MIILYMFELVCSGNKILWYIFWGYKLSPNVLFVPYHPPLHSSTSLVGSLYDSVYLQLGVLGGVTS